MQIDDKMVVAIDYTLTELGKSDILDSSEGREPLEFITGKGHIIPGLEKQLFGMKVGESADIKVDAIDAYGEYNEEATQTLPKEQFADIDLEKGMTLYGQGQDGETVQVVVKDFNDDEVTIDFNHPLAGKDLLFSVNIVNVREATPDEILSGQIDNPDHCGSGCGCGH